MNWNFGRKAVSSLGYGSTSQLLALMNPCILSQLSRPRFQIQDLNNNWHLNILGFRNTLGKLRNVKSLFCK
jgi:hypothetical protein